MSINNDKALLKDKNNNLLHISRGILTCDGNTSSPKVSPLSVGSGSATELQFPSQAVELVILDVDGALQISEDSSMSRYAVMPANSGLTLQASTGGSVYLKGDSGTVTVQFYFHAL